MFVTYDVFVGLIVFIQTTACTIATAVFHYKIDYLTLFYSIYLLHKRIIFNLSLTLLLKNS